MKGKRSGKNLSFHINIHSTVSDELSLTIKHWVLNCVLSENPVHSTFV